jgi:O-antigen/teichoic acid export membrane protein
MSLAAFLNPADARYGAAREPFWALMSQAVTSGANFLTAMVIVRAAGLGEFGRYSVCFLILMVSRNFLNGTVLAPMAVIAPKLRRTSAGAYRGFLMANGLAFGIGTSLVLYAISGVLGWAIAAPWLPQLGAALALANFSANGADFLRRYQFATGRAMRAFAVDAVRFSLQLGLLIALALAPGDRLDAKAAVYVLAAGSFAGCLFGLSVWGKTVWRQSLSATMWPRHANFIRWMTPGVALETLQSAIPQFAATAILGEAALGLIKAAQTITNVLNLPWNALQQVLPSMAAARLGSAGYPAMARLLRKVGYLVALASLVLAAIVAAASPEVARYANIAETGKFTALMILFLLLNLVIGVRYPMLVLVNAVEDPSGNFAAAVVGLAMSICLSATIVGPVGEASVPIIAVANALATWLVLIVWHRRKRGEYMAIPARGPQAPQFSRR